MADGTRFAIVQWEDNLTSIISLQSIKCPRQPITQYLEGDYVTAPFGRQLYKARISEISEDRTCLTKKATPDGQFPLQYLFEEEEEMLESQDEQPTSTTAGQLKADDISTHTETAGSSSSDVSAPKVKTVPLSADVLAPRVQTVPTSANVSAPRVQTVPTSANVSAPRVQTVPTSANVSAPRVQTVPTSANVSAPKVKAPSSSADVSDPQVRTVSSPAQSPVGANSSKRKSMEHLERDVKELRSSVKALKKRVQELEEKSQDKPGPSASVSVTESDDAFLAVVSHLSGTNEKDVNSIVRRLVLKMFTREELTTCTRTGKKTSKTGEVPKPPLDDEKLRTLERLVLTKCPSMTTEIFKKKIDNILKMERRAGPKYQY